MADVKHAVYNSDNVSATTDGSLIVSMKYMGSGSAATAIDNGNIVLVGELMAGEKQIHKATTPAANSPRAQLAIVTTVEEDKKAVLKSDTNLENTQTKPVKLLEVSVSIQVILLAFLRKLLMVHRRRVTQ